jgi:hypothetical protein
MAKRGLKGVEKGFLGNLLETPMTNVIESFNEVESIYKCELYASYIEE